MAPGAGKIRCLRPGWRAFDVTGGFPGFCHDTLQCRRTGGFSQAKLAMRAELDKLKARAGSRAESGWYT